MMAARQYAQDDDVINMELSKFLSLIEVLHSDWDKIMEMPESRTRWMFDTLIKIRKEAEREAETKAEAQRFARGSATMG